MEKNLPAIPDMFEADNFRGNYNGKDGKVTKYIDVNTATTYTQEIVKCAMDIIYFANMYYTIIAPGKGKHIIKTYPRQDDLIKEMAEKDRLAVLASRQVGKTTSYNIFCLWTACFQKEKKILIMANKKDAALEFLSRIKLAYELLPKWLKPGIVIWNASKIVFSNGCQIEGCATTPDSARGKSCDILVIDEMAFVPPKIMDDLWSSVYPIVSSALGTKVIVVSTPNGASGLFYEMYQSGAAGINEEGWTAFKFLWDEVPGRDEAWKRKQIASFGGDKMRWNQEFGCQFIGSSYTLVDPEILQQIKNDIDTRNKEGKITFDNLEYDGYKVNCFKKSKKGHSYIIGCDIADGVGGDSSVIKVFDITYPLNIEEVACFADNFIPVTDMPYILASIGLEYNIAPLMIEANAMGSSVIELLHMVYEYPNIVTTRTGKGLGVFSTNKVKVDACLNFKTFIDNENLNVKFNTVDTITELMVFEKKICGSVTGFTYKSNGKNDDHVMATIWAFYLLKQELIDFYFDVTFKQMGLVTLPVKCDNFYSESDINREREHFKTWGERSHAAMKITQIDQSDINSFSPFDIDKKISPPDWN
jgi:hypothetical protein